MRWTLSQMLSAIRMLLKQLRISLLQKSKYSFENTKIPGNTNIPGMWSTVSQMLAECRFSTANGALPFSRTEHYLFLYQDPDFQLWKFHQSYLLKFLILFFWCNQRYQSVSKLHFFRESSRTFQNTSHNLSTPSKAWSKAFRALELLFNQNFSCFVCC